MTNVYLKHQYCSKFFGGKISHFTQPFTLMQPTCDFQLSSPWFWCLNLSSDTKCCRRKCAASVLYFWINLVFHSDHSLYFLFNSCLKHLGFLIFQSCWELSWISFLSWLSWFRDVLIFFLYWRKLVTKWKVRILDMVSEPIDPA